MPQVLYSFGREDALDRDAIKRLVASLARLLDPADALAATAGSDLVFLESRPVGGVHVLDALWRRLNIGTIICGAGQKSRGRPRHNSGDPPLPWTVTTLGSLGTGGTPMVTKYQKFGDGYKAEAVKLYRESNQTIAETARNLGLKESTLANWIKKDKDNEAVAAGWRAVPRSAAPACAGQFLLPDG